MERLYRIEGPSNEKSRWLTDKERWVHTIARAGKWGLSWANVLATGEANRGHRCQVVPVKEVEHA